MANVRRPAMTIPFRLDCQGHHDQPNAPCFRGERAIFWIILPILRILLIRHLLSHDCKVPTDVDIARNPGRIPIALHLSKCPDSVISINLVQVTYTESPSSYLGRKSVSLPSVVGRLRLPP
jgi:hypothetical protein